MTMRQHLPKKKNILLKKGTIIINMDNGTFFFRPVPQDVKEQFKTWCVLRGVTMTEMLVKLMVKTVKQDLELRHGKGKKHIPLHQKFKAYCTRRGLTMQEKITRLMKETLNGQHKHPQPARPISYPVHD